MANRYTLTGVGSMPSGPRQAVALTCHPDTPAAFVQGIVARVGRFPGGLLAVSYIVEGDMDRLRVPAPHPPRMADRLWEHTCCEIFIARKGLPAYHELNLSPSGEWAAHAFSRYREGALSAGASGEAFDPQIAARSTAGKLELDVLIPLDRLSPAYRDAKLSLALSAIIEDLDGSISYWALQHPRGRPDFHHAAAYALDLPGTDPSFA